MDELRTSIIGELLTKTEEFAKKVYPLFVLCNWEYRIFRDGKNCSALPTCAEIEEMANSVVRALENNNESRCGRIQARFIESEFQTRGVIELLPFQMETECYYGEEE